MYDKISLLLILVFFVCCNSNNSNQKESNAKAKQKTQIKVDAHIKCCICEWIYFKNKSTSGKNGFKCF